MPILRELMDVFIHRFQKIDISSLCLFTLRRNSSSICYKKGKNKWKNQSIWMFTYLVVTFRKMHYWRPDQCQSSLRLMLLYDIKCTDRWIIPLGFKNGLKKRWTDKKLKELSNHSFYSKDTHTPPQKIQTHTQQTYKNKHTPTEHQYPQNIKIKKIYIQPSLKWRQGTTCLGGGRTWRRAVQWLDRCGREKRFFRIVSLSGRFSRLISDIRRLLGERGETYGEF